MFNTPEFKVGALVVTVSALIGVMSLKVNEGPGLFSRSHRYWFDVQDANGLVQSSAVKAAGIKVGVIEDIKLVGNKARVNLLIDGDLAMRTSGFVELRSDGILGDRHVELVPGDPKDPELENGSQILSTQERGSMQALMKEVGKITESLSNLGETLNRATGPNGDSSTTLGRIVMNIENLTKDLSDISGNNKKKIADILDRVHSISSQVDHFLADESPEGFRAGWDKAASALHRMDSVMKNVDEIAAKINEGKGTIGRLINDEETVDKLNEAVGSVSDFVGGATQMETSLDFHSEFLADADMTKSYLNVKIQPGLDRYYEIGVVDDPRGVVEDSRTVQTGSVSSDYYETKTFKNKIKYNVLFAKNFYNFTVKGGLIESSGGLGVDYRILGDKLKFSMELFNFDDATLRAFLRYNILRGIYVIGGGDELVNDDLRSGFLGAGLFITNDDLKMFASKVSF